MAIIQDKVNPGDVISSDLLNRIIALLNQHDALIASGLNPGTGNLLTGFDPSTEQNVGKLLTVFGSFDFPLTGNSLTIDGIPIAPAEFQLGSSAAQLIFKVPESILIPQGGSKSVLVRVVNSKGVGELTYLLRAAVAGAPNPDIVSIVNHANGNPTLRIGSEARIVGTNFAAPAANNRVRLIFNEGTQNAVAYPASASASLAINVAASTIVTGGSSTLVVAMPPIDDTLRNLIPQNQPVAATIVLTAVGANLPDKQLVQITRTMP